MPITDTKPVSAASSFLLVEHREHLLAFLPYAILLACPLMHLFMQHGHGHHGVQTQEKERYTALRLHA